MNSQGIESNLSDSGQGAAPGAAPHVRKGVSDTESDHGQHPADDPDLGRLIAAWPDLPAAIRRSVLATIKVAGRGE